MGWWVAVEIVSVWLRWRWCCRAGFLSRCPVELEVERRHRHDLHVKREARRWMEIFAILISISLKRTCRLDRRGREAELFNLLAGVARPLLRKISIFSLRPPSFKAYTPHYHRLSAIHEALLRRRRNRDEQRHQAAAAAAVAGE
ncbi:hypothetical protein HPP92_007864 [Vanilla planifolia]|uniref:Secreted protein n=1 Tax=Vanilla planifolia TaxID=51239 RepID=A0A835V946_VANPL|nr:hypothetical protein HPP92_007864 [Vanilla planifolia]